MIVLLSRSVFYVVLCAISTSTLAQTTYKCGNIYSETPCADGKVVATDDKRTDDQKRQADASTARAQAAAGELEKDRIAREKQEAMALKKANSPTKTEQVKRTPFKALKPKLVKPEKPAKAIKAAKKKTTAKPAG